MLTMHEKVYVYNCNTQYTKKLLTPPITTKSYNSFNLSLLTTPNSFSLGLGASPLITTSSSIASLTGVDLRRVGSFCCNAIDRIGDACCEGVVHADAVGMRNARDSGG